MADYPKILTPTNHVEPVARRVRGYLGGECVVDSTRALYVWEWPNYPQYYFPVEDVQAEFLVPEGEPHPTDQGMVQIHAVVADDERRSHAASLHLDSTLDGVTGTVRFAWAALDSWFEEDEQVFVHPRDPYTRVDAIRSTRRVRVELDGVLLANTRSPVLVFETGLPTRYYINRTDIDFTNLHPTRNQSACPYKGVTSGYWTATLDDVVYQDIAWTYDFPTRELQPIAGLVAFYNERVDTIVDGVRVDRPVTHLS